MKTIRRLRCLCISLVLVSVPPVLHAAFVKSEHWVDKDFASYNIRVIELNVSGEWSGTKSEMDMVKVAAALKKNLRSKGYTVVEEADASKQAADAILNVVFQAAQASGHKNLPVAAELKLTTGVKKVVYTASGEVKRSVQFKAERELHDVLDYLPECEGGGKKGGKK